MHQRFVTIAAAFAMIVSCGQHALADRGADFNGDGFDDLVIGVPNENHDADGSYGTGAVHVIYGGHFGLAATGSQRWSQSSSGIADVPETGDSFGKTLAWGDFNGDGFDDLAIGVPGEKFAWDFPAAGAGAVHVLYGGPSGLTANASQFWTLDSPDIPGASGSSNQFGFTLAVGDFNGDAHADVAIGAWYATGIGPDNGRGVVYILHGSDSGLTAENVQVWHADIDGLEGESHPQIIINTYDGEYELDETWASALRAGDFNGDGFDDLAVGCALNIIEEGVYDNVPGAVNIIYGSPEGLKVAGNQLFDQDTPGIPNAAERFDYFGHSLAVGDFNADGFEDLAIGAPYEDTANVNAHGVVHVLFGGPAGLSSTATQYFFQGSLGIQGTRESVDLFGFTLAAADFDGDGFDDLAIAAPSESTSNGEGCGIVNFLRGSPAGLNVFGNQVLRREHPHEGDRFGLKMSDGDYDGDGRADLTVGAPNAEVAGHEDAGIVLVFYGRADGLRKTCDEAWHQNSPGIKDVAESNDWFGGTL